jgi:ribonuclease BN (tRNA processing enzyme)
MTAAQTQIILLGTGTPNADAARSGPSVAIVVGGRPYIIDFGPGVVRQAAAAGLEICELRTAFATHLHSDHTVGYADLILTPWVLGRNTPLDVYGPKGLDAMTLHLLAAYKVDIQGRLAGLEPANDEGHRVNAHEIESGPIYEDDCVKVEAFRVDHPPFNSYAYKFTTADRTIVVSGDTAPSKGWAEFCADCDVLIHEVQSATGLARRAPEWQAYHSRVHTTTTQLAALATQARPGLLILTHQLHHGVSDEELLQEIRKNYDGTVVSGKDLEVY